MTGVCRNTVLPKTKFAVALEDVVWPHQMLVCVLKKNMSHVKLKLSLCFNWAPLHGGVLGSGDIRLHSFFDLGIRWRWVVSFTPRLLYPHGKSPWYPLDRRLGGSQSRSGRGGEEKNSQPPPGIEPQNSDRPARSRYTDWAITALQCEAGFWPKEQTTVNRK
jgi:hypothetical protein